VLSLLRLSGVVAAVVLSACAAAPAKQTQVAPTVDENAVNALYAEVDAASALGEDGLRRYRDGDLDGASAALAAAREQLTATAGRCLATPGCEIERVLLAQDALLDHQAQQLLEREIAQAESVELQGEAGVAPDVATAAPEAVRGASLLKGRDLRTMVKLNEPIRAALEEWLTWLRPNLLEAHENYQYLRYRMYPAYEQSGMPEALLFAILAKESGGKVHAISRAGASGPLQFMYYTGTRYGLGRVDGFDTRFDPALSARANVAYLNDQLRVFNDNLELALGAYNGGEGRMQRLSPRGSRAFWDPQVIDRLPPETREYVPMVLAAAWLFLHPEEYNLRFPVVDARPSAIDLKQTLSLNELAICMGQDGNERGWFRTLRNLNPRHDPNVRLPAGTRLDVPQTAAAAYEKHCVAGPLLAISQQLHDARAPLLPAGYRLASGSGRTHVVRPGETLGAIARRYGCSLQPLAAVNRIRPPRYAIRAGQKLSVPACRA
jgi:membrane-bound lytic murein transglycosylase D